MITCLLVGILLAALAALTVVCTAYSSLISEHERLAEVHDQVLRQLEAQEDERGEP